MSYTKKHIYLYDLSKDQLVERICEQIAELEKLRETINDIEKTCRWSKRKAIGE